MGKEEKKERKRKVGIVYLKKTFCSRMLFPICRHLECTCRKQIKKASKSVIPYVQA